MRRNRQLLYLVLALLGVAFLLLLLLAGIALQRRQAHLEAPVMQAAVDDAPADEVAEAAPVDPWAGREEEAIERVRAIAVGDTTVGERIAAGALAELWTDGERVGVGAATWVAERDVERGEGHHIVRYQLPLEGLAWGPRWRVDLGGEEPPEPEEALAALLLEPSREASSRLYNRAEEVVTALTHHRFGGAYRLGGALLVQLRTDGALDIERALGWLVVPEVVEPDGSLVYLAAFRWRVGDTTRAALWDVDLQNRQFRPRNLLANQVMSRAQRVVDMEIRPLELPRSGAGRTPLDLSLPPERERTPLVRALRFVVSDERLREAVAMLLAVEDNNGLIHRGWRADPGDGPRHFLVAYVVEREGEEDRIRWGVDADRGAITPLSPIAKLADRVLRIADEAL